MIGRGVKKGRVRLFCSQAQLPALGCLIKWIVWERGVDGSGAVSQQRGGNLKGQLS